MKIICYGDSNTYGYDPVGQPELRYPAHSRWVDLVSRNLPESSKIFNAGQNGREIPDNGWESAAGAADQLAAATEAGDLIIIMLGGNDILLGGCSAEKAAEKMRRFLGAIKMEAPGREILLAAPVIMEEGFWVPDSWYIEESAQLVKKYGTLAEEMDIRFADTNCWGVTLTGDGVHFTKEGHKAFAEGLTKCLKLWYSII